MGKLDDALSPYVRLASELKVPRKTPTGIFPVDFYLDGGFAEGFIHVVAGKYKGGKTTMLMKAIANSQKKYPHKQNFWFDFEGTFDMTKAVDHGIDLSRLHIVRPETGGEAADLICLMIDERCSDIGIIAIDSLNRIVNAKEFDKEADEHTIAYNAEIVTKLLKRVGAKLNSMSFKTEDRPTVLAVSQIRANIGFGFKDYKIPGAKALEHDASCILVCNPGREFEDKKNNELALAEFKVIFDKVKVSSFHIHQVEYAMCIGRAQVFENGEPIPTGFVDDFNFVKGLLKDYGMLGGGSTKQKILTPELEEINFKNQNEMMYLLYSDEGIYARLKDRILTKRREDKRLISIEPYMEYEWNRGSVDVQEES